MYTYFICEEQLFVFIIETLSYKIIKVNECFSYLKKSLSFYQLLYTIFALIAFFIVY